jgi:PTH1 family peptidyl-tRNA hydrolase
VLGLGNPGPRYEDTRHNLGVRVIEALARSRGRNLEDGPGPSRICPAVIGGETGLLAWPLTWMNRSGVAAVALRARFGGPPLERFLVVTDDLDLPLGRLRFRRGGGPGGHNGLRSLVEELGSREFPRLRLGIGRPDGEGRDEVVDHVLDPFLPDERPVVDEVVRRAVDGVELFVAEGIEAAMNRINASDGRPESDRDRADPGPATGK